MSASPAEKPVPAALAGLLAASVPVLLAAALAASVLSCRTYNIERKLQPVHADFLSKVSYIMTRDERKIFLDLPDTDKNDFIEEFWKRRDPDPDTEANEYRAEYERRVERAGALFHGEGRPGWQTDRGRIYVLFGPPSERLTYPMDPAGDCREVWYYGSFPVIFIDDICSGTFVMRAINLEHLQELNIAQGHFQKTFDQEKRTFDYTISMEKLRSEPGVFEGAVHVDIPYNAIWFAFEEGRLETSFDVRIDLSDESGTTLWEAHDSFPLSLEESELTKNRKGRFRMAFPVLITENLDRLRSQRLRMEVAVKSTTEGQELKKIVEFRLKT